jgi:uroporphyrinogen-III synthase
MVTNNAARPLDGKTILVTRSAGQSSQFTHLLEQEGATVLEMPAIAITPPSTWAPLDDAIAHLDRFDWLILTSSNGVDYFCDRLAQGGYLLDTLNTVKIAVVGKKTAHALAQRGLEPDFIPPNFVADALVEHFPQKEQMPGLKILFPRVETGGREVLVRELTQQGAIVTEVPAYESGCVRTVEPAIEQALRQGKVDVITFASSKTVHCFAQLIDHWGDRPTIIPNWDYICLASIGPQTSLSCRECFGRVTLEAEEYTLDGLTQSIVQWATA